MDEKLRGEALEFIAIALAELKGMAQPRELAELRELEVEAEEATTDEQSLAIWEQAKNLRLFCERRRMTGQQAPVRKLQ